MQAGRDPRDPVLGPGPRSMPPCSPSPPTAPEAAPRLRGGRGGSARTGSARRSSAAAPAAMHANRAGQILCCTQALGRVRGLLGPLVEGDLDHMPATASANSRPGAAPGLSSPRRRFASRAGAPTPWTGRRGRTAASPSCAGCRAHAVDALCARFDAAVAIVNPADSYVLGGGGRAGLKPFCEEARPAGAAPRRAARRPCRLAHRAAGRGSAPTFRAALRGAPGVRPGRHGGCSAASTPKPCPRPDSGPTSLRPRSPTTVPWADCLAPASRQGRPCSSNLDRDEALPTWSSHVPGRAGAQPGRVSDACRCSTRGCRER